MCGCSDEDYDHGTRPEARYQYNQPQYGRPPYHHEPPRPIIDRRREDAEKRQRELEARQAADRYGWPRERDYGSSNNNNNKSSNRRDSRRKDLDIRTPGNRDSYLVPSLNQSFVGMPDSDYASYMPASHARGPVPAVYRPPPSRPYQPYEPPPYYQPQPQQQRQLQPQNSSNSPVIRQQPPRAKPMGMGMTVHTSLEQQQQQQQQQRRPPAVPARQGSIAVSECGSDVDVSEGYVVSPMSESSPFSPPPTAMMHHRSPGAYGSLRSGRQQQYGRDGGAF